MIKDYAKKNPRHIPVTKEGATSMPISSNDSLEKLFGKTKIPTRLDRGPQRRIRPLWVVIGGVALLAIAAVIGFFVFGGKQFSGDNVSLTLNTNTEAASGDLITITIDYANDEPVALGNASLVVRYPEGFTVHETSMEPQTNGGNSWDLATLTSHEKGSLTITGQLDGEVGSMKEFSAKLVYKPSDFNATFETEGSVTVTITESIIILKLEGPTRVAPGTTANYTLKYTSTSEGVLENLTITPEWPTTFTVSAVDPALNENKQWPVPRLTKSEGGQVTFSGTFAGDVGDSIQLSFIVNRTTTDGFSEKQLTYQPIILLVGGQVSLTMKLNGSEEATPVEHGDTLAYTLDYKNNTEFELTNVSFSLALDEFVLNYDELTMTPQGSRDNKKITWNKDTVSGLAALKPGDSGTLALSIPIRTNLTIDTTQDVNFSVTATASGSVGGVTDGDGLTITIPTVSRETKIASLVTLGAEARYYTEGGSQVGSGPLPPKVGQPTTYRIYLTLQNNTNDVKDVTVTAKLADHVTWKGSPVVSAGTITYNDSNKTFTWSINQIPAGSGYYIPALTAQFSITLTPTDSDVGTIPELTNTITFHGTDMYTEQSRTTTASHLTTELTYDTAAVGKGKVVK